MAKMVVYEVKGLGVSEVPVRLDCIKPGLEGNATVELSNEVILLLAESIKGLVRALNEDEC